MIITMIYPCHKLGTVLGAGSSESAAGAAGPPAVRGAKSAPPLSRPGMARKKLGKNGGLKCGKLRKRIGKNETKWKKNYRLICDVLTCLDHMRSLPSIQQHVQHSPKITRFNNSKNVCMWGWQIVAAGAVAAMPKYVPSCRPLEHQASG